MPDVREVADRVYRFEVPISGMPEVPVVYLIGEPQAALIEPGPGAAAPDIQRAMTELGMKSLSFIIPTHIHVDHAGGTGALAKLFPKAKVVVHPRGVKHLVSPERLVESTRLVWGQDFERTLGPIIPVPESQLMVAENGEVLSLGNRELRIIYAVGHSPNHIVVLDRKVNGLFCGEALGLPPHQLPSVAPYSFEQDIYVTTIERLQTLKLDALFFSHGDAEGDAGRLMFRALESARVYCPMILEAAKSGRTMDEIMPLVSDDFRRRFGQDLTRNELEIGVAGYLMYFKSKGMLA